MGFQRRGENRASHIMLYHRVAWVDDGEDHEQATDWILDVPWRMRLDCSANFVSQSQEPCNQSGIRREVNGADRVCDRVIKSQRELVRMFGGEQKAQTSNGAQLVCGERGSQRSQAASQP